MRIDYNADTEEANRDTRKLFILKFERNLRIVSISVKISNFSFDCGPEHCRRAANKNETQRGQEKRVKVMTNLLRLFEFIHGVVFFSCRNVIKLMSTP